MKMEIQHTKMCGLQQESSSQRKAHDDKCLLRNKKISNKKSNFTPQETEGKNKQPSPKLVEGRKKKRSEWK